MNIHSNARTCPNSRATIVTHVKAKAWSSEQAFAMGISTRTGYKWSRRYRDNGLEGLLDRSSRPRLIPNLTEPARAELVVRLRRCRLTALEIAGKLRMPRSTVAAVLKRAGLSRLRYLDPRSLSGATSTRRQEILFTSTSRNWAEFAVSVIASPATGATDLVAQAGSTSTWPSMTSRVWPTQRSSPTSREKPRPASCDGRWSSFGGIESGSSGCLPTTAAHTAHTYSSSSARVDRSPPSAPGPIGRARTERPNDSSRRFSESGRTSGPIRHHADEP